MKKYLMIVALVSCFNGNGTDSLIKSHSRTHSRNPSVVGSLVTVQPQPQGSEDSSICLACIIAASKGNCPFPCPPQLGKCVIGSLLGTIGCGECLIIAANLVL